MKYNFTRDDMIKTFCTYVCETCANIYDSHNFIDFNNTLEPYSNNYATISTLTDINRRKSAIATISLEKNNDQYLNVITYQKDKVIQSISANLSSDIDKQLIQTSNELADMTYKIQQFCTNHLLYLHSSMSNSEYTPLVYVDANFEKLENTQSNDLINANSIAQVIGNDNAFDNIFNDIKHHYRNFTISIQTP